MESEQIHGGTEALEDPEKVPEDRTAGEELKDTVNGYKDWATVEDIGVMIRWAMRERPVCGSRRVEEMLKELDKLEEVKVNTRSLSGGNINSDNTRLVSHPAPAILQSPVTGAACLYVTAGPEEGDIPWRHWIIWTLVKRGRSVCRPGQRKNTGSILNREGRRYRLVQSPHST